MMDTPGLIIESDLPFPYYNERHCSPDAVFEPHGDQAHPLYLEIGCGNGHFLAAMVESSPEVRWVALECKKRRVRKTAEKLAKLGSCSVTLVYADFFTAGPAKLGAGIYNRIFLNFPDPWPKKRHAKRRLLNPDTLPWYKRMLKPGGVISIATDHLPLVEFMLETFSADNSFANLFPPYRNQRELPGSLFGDRFAAEQVPHYYLDFSLVGQS